MKHLFSDEPAYNDGGVEQYVSARFDDATFVGGTHPLRLAIDPRENYIDPQGRGIFAGFAPTRIPLITSREE